MDPTGVGGFHADCPRPFRVTLASEIITITGLLLFLYVAEPMLSHIAALRSWTV